jgi:hypothetical protein
LPRFVARFVSRSVARFVPRSVARFWRMMLVWNEATQGRPKPGMH